MLSAIRTHDTVDPGSPSGHRTCAVGCFVSCGPGFFVGTLSSSWVCNQAFAGKGGKMGVGSTRPPRKEYWADWSLGGSWGRGASMDKRSHFCKGQLAPTPLRVKPFTLAFSPEAGGLSAGFLPSHFLVLGAGLSLGLPSIQYTLKYSLLVKCQIYTLRPASSNTVKPNYPQVGIHRTLNRNEK